MTHWVRCMNAFFCEDHAALNPLLLRYSQSPSLFIYFFLIAEPLPFPTSSGKSFIMGSDDVLESVLGLGDLADLTVSNDEAEYSYDVSTLAHPLWCHDNKGLSMFTACISLSPQQLSDRALYF